MNTQQLYRVLDATPANQNIMLMGRHGIGKSQILTDYYTARGLRVVTLFLGQMADPGDLIGLPEKHDGRTRFVPPYWFPIDDQPVVLFLDELNRARPEMLQTVMDLALNRCLAGHRLPEGSRVVAACNEGDDYQLTMLDPALLARFNVYHFQPTTAEWLLWAEKQHLDERVVAFIREEPNWLEDPRAWARLAELVKPIRQLTEDDAVLMAGVVGIAATSRFLGFVTGKHLITGSQVLSDFAAVRDEVLTYPLHKLALVNESLFQHLQVLNNQPLPLYAENLEAYLTALEEHGEKEALAHLANIFEQGTYDQAILFIVSQAPAVYQKLIAFVAALH